MTQTESKHVPPKNNILRNKNCSVSLIRCTIQVMPIDLCKGCNTQSAKNSPYFHFSLVDQNFQKLPHFKKKMHKVEVRRTGRSNV